MKLYYTRPSPFARKVRASAILLGLDSRIELIPTDPNENPPALHDANPLGQIPALLTDDGFALFDSVVICDYLSDIAGDLPLIPPAGAARWSALRLQAMADGLLNAAVLRRKLAMQTDVTGEQPLVVRQKAAIRRTLAMLEMQPLGQHLDIGLIAVGCALGFLDFRFAEEPWRDGHPLLAAWFEAFAQHDCMRLTDPGL